MKIIVSVLFLVVISICLVFINTINKTPNKNININYSKELYIKEGMIYTDYLMKNDNYNTMQDFNKKRQLELKLCKEFLKKYPNNYPAQSRLANIYYELDKTKEAAKIFSKIIKTCNLDLCQNDIIIYSSCYQNSNPKKSLEILTEHVDKFQVSDFYYYELGITYSNLKNYELSIENYTKAIELNQKSTYYLSRARAYWELGDKTNYDKDMATYDALTNRK